MRADKKVSENPENLGSRRSWRSKIMNPINNDYWVLLPEHLRDGLPVLGPLALIRAQRVPSDAPLTRRQDLCVGPPGLGLSVGQAVEVVVLVDLIS